MRKLHFSKLELELLLEQTLKQKIWIKTTEQIEAIEQKKNGNFVIQIKNSLNEQ